MQKKRTKDKRTREKGTPDCPAGHERVVMLKDTNRMINEPKRHRKKVKEGNIAKEKDEKKQEDKRKGNSRLPCRARTRGYGEKYA